MQNKWEYKANIGKEEEQAVLEVLKKKDLSGFHRDFEGGEKVKEYEKSWQEYLSIEYAITVNSGTSALHTALMALGIKKGDEVIVTPYSFSASATCVLMVNATPVFVDIDENTYNMNPDLIEQKITKKTKAIIPVHLYGQPCDMDKIMQIAKKHKLYVIEDACQAPGSEYDGKKVGTIGDIGIFSTVETKNITTGEGGVIVTNNKDIASDCKLIRNHGEVYLKGLSRSYLSEVVGYNFRMTEINAAIGIEQMKKLDSFNEQRNKLASYLIRNLKNIRGITVPKETPKSKMVYHILCLRYKRDLEMSREQVIKQVRKKGVTIDKGYPRPIYKNPTFKKYASNCPNAEKVCQESIIIRLIRPEYNIKDMVEIVSAFEEVLI